MAFIKGQKPLLVLAVVLLLAVIMAEGARTLEGSFEEVRAAPKYRFRRGLSETKFPVIIRPPKITKSVQVSNSHAFCASFDRYGNCKAATVGVAKGGSNGGGGLAATAAAVQTHGLAFGAANSHAANFDLQVHG